MNFFKNQRMIKVLAPFLIITTLIGLVSVASLLFGMSKCPRPILDISSPTPRIGLSLRSPGFFEWKMEFLGHCPGA